MIFSEETFKEQQRLSDEFKLDCSNRAEEILEFYIDTYHELIDDREFYLSFQSIGSGDIKYTEWDNMIKSIIDTLYLPIDLMYRTDWEEEIINIVIATRDRILLRKLEA